MAEAGQDVAAPQSLLHQPRRVAEALRFLEQDLNEAVLAAVPVGPTARSSPPTRTRRAMRRSTRQRAPRKPMC